MNNPRCGVCGAKTKKNGRTSAGTQRWRCTECGSSSVRRICNEAKTLEAFLAWLLSKDAIADLTGEVHDVVFLDGIWLRRKAVLLIAVAGGHVLAWHLARSENAEAWAALMMRVPAPAMAVSDGSPGLAKAARAVWPSTRIQRCTFHASSQVRRYTTLRPKLEAGRELLDIANRLAAARDADSAARWLVDYSEWCTRWDGFLREHSFKDGKKVWTHERLRRARRSLNGLVRDGTLFTFVEMSQERGGEWPSTNNAVESANARIREMLYLHRGLPLVHRIKAIFWWCYMHTENPLPAAEILRVMPTDADVDGLFATASQKGVKSGDGPEEHGSGIVWGEFHMPTRFRQ